MIVGLHGRRQDIAARGPIVQGKGAWLDDHAIDPTRVTRIRPDDAQRREAPAERQIDHGILGMVEAAMVGVAKDHLGRGVESREVRGVRDDLDGAAHGARSV